jgi:DNA-binding NtrC family response regulator
MYIVHVDGDPGTHDVVRRARERIANQADLISVDTLRSALCVLSSVSVACVITDLALRDACGPEIVHKLYEAQPGVSIVVLASKAAGPPAARGRVREWLAKDDADPDAIVAALGTALGVRLLADVASADAIAEGPEVVRFGGTEFIAGTLAMRRVLSLVESAAESDVPVLLEGETGTGKEILARAVHARSARRAAAIVVQNCGAMPDQLLESELFGHVRGAFTGAERDRPGLFLEAGGGTVFLDEIGEASPVVQARLLRVLQHREVKPVGSDRPQHVGARIVAATNRSLSDEVRAGRFRADLYYRLAVFPIRLPPLRQRATDIPRLVRAFLTRVAAAEHRECLTVSEGALRLLTAYHWPGNVRELEHEIHRLVLTLPPASPILPEHLASHIRHRGDTPVDEPLDDILARVEMALIRERLDRFPTKADAARSLGITREGLYAKLRRLGIASSTLS